MQFAFGGPDAYRGRDIALAHEKLIREHGLNARHFDLVAGYFAESLQELGTPQEHIDEALEVRREGGQSVCDDWRHLAGCECGFTAEASLRSDCLAVLLFGS